MPSRTDISLVVEKGRPFGQIKSVDDVQPPAEYSFFLTVMVCVTAVTGFLMGYDLCIVAVVLGPIREYFGVCGSNYVDSAVGSDPCIMNELFVAILAPGAMVSSLIGGWAADKFGRRALLIASDIFFASAATLMAVSTSYWSMLLGRSLLGVGIGMGFVVFPAYMAEVSPAEVRGALVTCQEVAQCIGCLSAYGIAFIVSPADHWRGLLLAAGIPAILQLFGTLILPESPRWLVANNKLKQARIALEKISGYQPFCGTNKFDDPHNELISNFVETILCREIELPDEPTKLDRVRASKLVLAQAEMEESIKKFNDLEELDCEVRSVALTLASRSASRTSIGDTDFLAETEFPPAMPQPPLQILLDLMEEQEVRENGKEKRREDQRIRYEEELVSAKAEGHLGLIKYSFLRVKSVCTLRGRLSRLLDHKYALLVACGCAAAQNLTGANTILYYSVDLFKMGGICNPLFAGVMIGVVKFFGVCLMLVYLERIGRRLPLMVGTGGTMLCHLALAVRFSCANIFIFQATFKFGTFTSCPADLKMASRYPTSPSSLGVMLLIWGLMFFWNISWAGLMFVVASEVLPSGIRGVGMGIAIATFWLLAFVFQLAFRLVVIGISETGTFLILGSLSTVVLTFVYLYIPDYTGKTLEEINSGGS